MELNSKKHHQYQPHSKERSGKPPPPGKSGKYYYQLNSKKQPEVILLDSDLDEPIDLRCVKMRSDAGEPPSTLQVKPEAPAVAAVVAPAPASEKPPAEAQEEPVEPLSEFKPFFGNIIITDVTANCLTVTFKEYVTV